MCIYVCVYVSLIDPSSTKGATLPTVQGEIEVNMYTVCV